MDLTPPPVGAWMTDVERARDVRMPTARAVQFRGARWLLRTLLAELYGGEPADWPISAAAHMAPRIDLASAPHVAISHSGAWVAVACANRPVGLDLEASGPRRDIARLLHAVACEEELTAFAALPAADHPAAFQCLWTLKEAWFKQQGRGIGGFGGLQRLHTRPCGEDANAQVWTCDDWTLALVADGVLTVHAPTLGKARPYRVAPDGRARR
jgi:4'-phosphopantetheinyl transferase